MNGYLVDTDWIIDSLHGQTEATETLIQLASHGLFVSLISYGELYEGAYYAVDASAALRGLTEFLRGKRLVPLSRSIMERFGVVRRGLRRHGLAIGDTDLMIAATALQHDLTLLTRNYRHFARIPALELYPSA